MKVLQLRLAVRSKAIVTIVISTNTAGGAMGKKNNLLVYEMDYKEI